MAERNCWPPLKNAPGKAMTLVVGHSLSECGFQVPKRPQAPAHIWDLPRLWKSLLLVYKIFDIRTCGLSHQIKGPTTVKLAFLQLINAENRLENCSSQITLQITF